MDGEGNYRKFAVILVIMVIMLSASNALIGRTAAPEIQITPEQHVEPTIIVPETGMEDLVFGSWVIWAVLIVFALVILISLIIRSGSPG